MGTEEGTRRSGRVPSIPGQGPRALTPRRRRSGPQRTEVGVLGATTLSREGGDVLASPGTGRTPPAPVSDPPRSRAPASRSRAPPRRLPPLAPQDLRTRWESTGRSPRPADALVPALGCLGLGARAGARTRAHTHTDTHTHTSSGGESPLFVAVRPQPVRDPQVLAGAIAQAWGWNQEGHPTPHTWHIGICPRASLLPWHSQRPAGRATERSWVRTEPERKAEGK